MTLPQDVCCLSPVISSDVRPGAPVATSSPVGSKSLWSLYCSAVCLSTGGSMYVWEYSSTPPPRAREVIEMYCVEQM